MEGTPLRTQTGAGASGATVPSGLGQVGLGNADDGRGRPAQDPLQEDGRPAEQRIGNEGMDAVNRVDDDGSSARRAALRP